MFRCPKVAIGPENKHPKSNSDFRAQHEARIAMLRRQMQNHQPPPEINSTDADTRTAAMESQFQYHTEVGEILAAEETALWLYRRTRGL